MAAYFVWNAKYSVQIPWIDHQHRGLMSLINKLAESMEDGRSHEIMAALLGKLADYTRIHFRDEEEVLVKYRYPLLVEHQSRHAEFISKLEEFQQSLSEHQEFLGMKVLDFLKDWLTTHILVEDKKYVEFLRSARFKLADAA